MTEDFTEYVKVKDLTVTGDETHLIRIRTNDHTFAHIEVERLPTVAGIYASFRCLRMITEPSLSGFPDWTRRNDYVRCYSNSMR